jgi:CheY-like chemotaxis protein
MSVMNIESSYNKNSSSPIAGLGRRKLILSVDDDSSVLYARYKLLSSMGYGVISANDGIQALQIFGSTPVDLVLLDYSMPFLDGGQVAEAMKEYKPNVPIILVSGADVPEKFLALVNGCVRKGEGPEALLTAITELMQSSVGSRLVAEVEHLNEAAIWP